MKKHILPIGITANGLSQEASRIFAEEDSFSCKKAVHLMLFYEISSNESLFDEYLSQKISIYLTADADSDLEMSTKNRIFGEVVTYLVDILRNVIEQLQEDSAQEDARFCIDICELAAANFKGIASDLATFQPSDQAHLGKFFSDTISFIAATQSVMATA